MNADALFDADHPETIGMHRWDDIDTAQGAAVIAIGNRTVNKRKVLEALYRAGDNGATDFELAAATGLIPTSAGKRRKDLQDETPSLVRRASAEDGSRLSRPSTTTGSPAAVWTLTAAGWIEAETVAAGCGYLTGQDGGRS